MRPSDPVHQFEVELGTAGTEVVACLLQVLARFDLLRAKGAHCRTPAKTGRSAGGVKESMESSKVSTIPVRMLPIACVATELASPSAAQISRLIFCDLRGPNRDTPKRQPTSTLNTSWLNAPLSVGLRDLNDRANGSERQNRQPPARVETAVAKSATK
jgi:hypothetical protein